MTYYQLLPVDDEGNCEIALIQNKDGSGFVVVRNLDHYLSDCAYHIDQE